jgi:hypothetical protein|tara:strand:+ start:211 stop:378 length:168 start_codon:yes stop_codon:yes gene_type:complete
MSKEAKEWMDNLEKEFGINIINKDEITSKDEVLNIDIPCSLEQDLEWANESENPQ